ncbi:MAG: PilZ domain-containing protein [Treponema sp.]|jgi:hypothetical protein|nr:PilZ domain-containing protein [Treponema sp.]
MTGNLYPLQTLGYFKEDDPRGAIVLLIGIGAILLTTLIFNIARGRVAATALGKSKSKTMIASKKFSGFTLHRIASAYGLDRNQTRLLEFVFRNDGVSDPERVLNNSNLLDKHFKRAYRTIERNATTEEEAQQRLSLLFSLRNTIEANPNIGAIPSSHQLTENMTAVLSNARESYPVKIMSSKGDCVIVECPTNALGTPIKMPKGTRVNLSFFTKTSQGFSFESRILGPIDTPRGLGMQLAHGKKTKPLAQRKYRRKQSSINCVFRFVFVGEQKGKKPPKLTVDSRRFTGIIQDISLGGCSIKTSASIQVGSRLKIDIDYSGELLISCLGQVLRTNRSGAIGTILHIKFLKVPRKALNAINALVFGYVDD